MDETEILSRLDDRGRAAAAAVHTAVADRPVPAFDPDVHRVALDGAPERPWLRRWAPLAGVAAALLLLLGAVAVLAGQGGDDDAPADRTGTVGPPRRWAPAEVPADLKVTSLGEGPAGTPSLGGPVLLFGPSPDEVELAVAVLTAPAPDPEEGDPLEGLDTVVLGDRTAGRLDGLGYGRSGLLLTIAGRQVIVGGRDRATVEAAATVVEVAGDRPVLAEAALPDGWSAQGELDDLTGLAAPVALARGDASGAGWNIAYTNGTTRLLSVASSTGDGDEVRAVRAFAGDARPVEVRGHPGVLATSPPPADAPDVGESIALIWVERPGEVLRVAGSGLTEAEVRAAAESLALASDATWAALARDSLAPDPSGGEVLVGEGTFSDGSAWTLLVQPDGASSTSGDLGPLVSLRTTLDGGSSGGTSTDSEEAGEPFDSFALSSSDTFAWAYGLTDERTATIEVVAPGGDVLGSYEVVSGGGYHGWVVELPLELAGLEPGGSGGVASGSSSGESSSSGQGSSSGAGPTSTAGSVDPDAAYLVARAADGTELARHQLT